MNNMLLKSIESQTTKSNATRKTHEKKTFQVFPSGTFFEFIFRNMIILAYLFARSRCLFRHKKRWINCVRKEAKIIFSDFPVKTSNMKRNKISICFGPFIWLKNKCENGTFSTKIHKTALFQKQIHSYPFTHMPPIFIIFLQ